MLSSPNLDTLKGALRSSFFLCLEFIDLGFFYLREGTHISYRTRSVAKSYKNAEGRTFLERNRSQVCIRTQKVARFES